MQRMGSSFRERDGKRQMERGMESSIETERERGWEGERWRDMNMGWSAA